MKAYIIKEAGHDIFFDNPDGTVAMMTKDLESLVDAKSDSHPLDD